MVVLFEGCSNASTAVVACDDDVFDFEDLDRILQDCKKVDIGRRGLVSNIAVHEDLSCFESADFVSWDSGVCTADPEVVWCLYIYQVFEEIGVLVFTGLCP